MHICREKPDSISKFCYQHHNPIFMNSKRIAIISSCYGIEMSKNRIDVTDKIKEAPIIGKRNCLHGWTLYQLSPLALVHYFDECQDKVKIHNKDTKYSFPST